MTDRDPLAYLTAANAAEQPDPEFARRLLDSLLADLGDEAVDTSIMQLVDVEAGTPTSKRRTSGLGSWILGAAAALVLIVGGVFALTTGSDEDSSSVFAGDPGAVPTSVAAPTLVPTQPAEASRTEPVPTPAPSAQDVAAQFMQARSDGDADALRSIVADDATITNALAVAEPGDLGVRTDFEQAMGFRIADVNCSELTAEIVSCEYSFENDLGRAFRLGPYRDHVAVFTIRDGIIHELVGGAAEDSFARDFETFATWLAENHPPDYDTLNHDPAQANLWLKFRLSPEAVVMVADRLAEFRSVFPPPILKALSLDGRFTVVVEALVATLASDDTLARPLADVFDDCTVDGPTTFFVPTDTAIEQYLSGNDLERETLFGDTALVRDVLTFLIVDQPVGRDELEALERPTQLESIQGETLTITGGPEPTLNGVELVDASAIEACNGAIHPIDELIIPSLVTAALTDPAGD
jgi:uncharacterized surface protein with fasciclin (FAS1) repeats